jgi:hypothetical protein
VGRRLVRAGRLLRGRRASDPHGGARGSRGDGRPRKGDRLHRHLARRAYADEPVPLHTETIHVAYFHAVPIGSGGSIDLQEVSEFAWFAWDELPVDVAPPGTLVSVLDAARAAHVRRSAVVDMPDRPA